MRRILPALALLALPATTAAAASERPNEAETARIMAALAQMQCEVDPADIEKNADGSFELDDVFCADGQYDIRLDSAYAVVEKRKE